MTAVVLDASAVIAWIAPGQATAEAWRLLEMARDLDLFAPYLFPAEVHNALLKLERQGRCTPAQADEGLELLGALEIVISPPTTSGQAQRLMGVARSEKLSFYDVLYLDLAERQAARLATRDGSLIEVARRRGVSVWDLQ